MFHKINLKEEFLPQINHGCFQTWVYMLNNSVVMHQTLLNTNQTILFCRDERNISTWTGWSLTVHERIAGGCDMLEIQVSSIVSPCHIIYYFLIQPQYNCEIIQQRFSIQSSQIKSMVKGLLLLIKDAFQRRTLARNEIKNGATERNLMFCSHLRNFDVSL